MNSIPADFNVDLPIPAKVVTCTIEGIVEEADVARLLRDRQLNEVPMGLQAGDLKKIRERHQQVARYEASGMKRGIIAALTGYDESSLSTLLQAPAMQELVGFYRLAHQNASEQVSERLKHVALKAVDKLEDQLDADELSGQELLGVAKLGLDRGGHGPHSKQTVVNEHHLIDHAELQRLNRAARADSAKHIIIQPDAITIPALEASSEDGE